MPHANNIPANMDSSFNSTPNIPNNPFDDQSTNDDLCALTLTDTRNNVRQAIAATYQGYCSELFVLGVCPRKQSGCPFDHSAPALEKCIRSFTLLSKRELHLHGQLPVSDKPYTLLNFMSNLSSAKCCYCLT